MKNHYPSVGFVLSSPDCAETFTVRFCLDCGVTLWPVIISTSCPPWSSSIPKESKSYEIIGTALELIKARSELKNTIYYIDELIQKKKIN